MEGNNDDNSDIQLPLTISEATALILSRMPEATKDFLRRIDDEIVLEAQLAKHFSAGMNVRAMLGLWGKNPRLLAQIPVAHRHPDDAASFFLVECWRRLRSSNS